MKVKEWPQLTAWLSEYKIKFFKMHLGTPIHAPQNANATSLWPLFQWQKV